ncbi:response regulator transcription factor [Owenweeksia hongkongensis]|uniref:Response regulator containing a CheY-like receiver domain and an HTH DNA-binding domain n=1 Tax=Owenweeksia hongkongensis (strain DSM 17368 / CIP 108786 / JCM 12287 / NRRL B-23963 / UST20020801) TaxID=926562 RepID=G8R0S2_OWEHD|nr:response regulator transcription factor [Owenweeksia hongkongensis]AEV33799.1 response regulator containing a CheY-like receiver domain and an HTH DNA-binding domain [Owenweeksia hongkongensis DSM 17368]
MIRLLLADDHAVVRKGLQLFIGYEDNLKLVAEASNGEELLEIIRDNEADVLLLDLDMPKMNGITAIRKIKEIAPDLKIIVLTMHPEDIYGKTALQMGASGYLIKDEEPKKLINAINKVYAGEQIFSEDLMSNKKKNKPIKLSQREIEVLKLLSSGHSNKDIAEELEISDKTVSTYKLRLLNKIGGKSVVDLINFSNNYPEVMGGRK